MNYLPLFSSLAASSFAGIVTAIFLVIILVLLAPVCLIFQKSGRQWWEAIIPVYNAYIFTVIVDVPWWVLIGFFIPFLNWVVGVYLFYRLSKCFGFDILFTLGLVFLPFIFLPILGFGGALYRPFNSM